MLKGKPYFGRACASMTNNRRQRITTDPFRKERSFKFPCQIKSNGDRLAINLRLPLPPAVKIVYSEIFENSPLPRGSALSS